MATPVQNITLKVPRKLLERAKVTAAQRGTSLNSLCIEGLERLLVSEATFTPEEVAFLDQFNDVLDQLISEMKKQNRQLDRALERMELARSR